MRSITLMLVALLSLAGLQARSQSHPPFWNEIQEFRHQDSLQVPPRHAVLFVGSSSFRKWTDVQQAFPSYPVINRGFGGSTLPDLIRYADDVIFRYQPRQVVIYCGDNDAASSSHITADSIFQRFQRLYRMIRSRLPKAQVTYISIKPSPSREKLFPVMDKANWEIRTFLEKEPRADFVDVYHPMLDDYGQPVKALFTGDMLHMNAQGYDLWQRLIAPHLKK